MSGSKSEPSQPQNAHSDETPLASPILAALYEVYRTYRRDGSGSVATYIPELARVDPSLFGISLATADGHVYEVGDARHPFIIQSISKPFVHGMALADRGRSFVLSKVGVEPTATPLTRSFSTNEATGRLTQWSMPVPSPPPRWFAEADLRNGWSGA